MKKIKSSNTKPEFNIRSKLHRAGYRFRKNYIININGSRCKPDIVFTKIKLAIFIDGCFWHCCPEHGHLPKSNEHYWKPKLDRNKARDAEDTNLLINGGWNVVRIWEHEPIEYAIGIITSTIQIIKGA